MKANAILRAVCLISGVLCFGLLFAGRALAQDVGADVGGSSVFRAKNPETKRKATATKPSTSAKQGTRTTPTRSNVAERVEDLLDKGNEARDSRNFAGAEDAYKEVLKLKPRDARAAYGLGNIYADQQRWDDAEAAYREAVAWAPNDADAHVALSVVLVQPRVKQGNAAHVLIEESTGSELLVVGTRGHGGFSGLVLGSVSQHVAAYARCPVTVVR